ncbi:hypothetical protein TanjilG_11394 [Lupinus angustifolius]|uniref:PGG domain-containing protein n=1 Tax=Lupinus angustifolius TaxID=3871 RepID=A0A1J7IGJ2_LUPAN|nr:hypothetical protein TanjilG_11394 [Lupinus angustifolius]
MNMDMENINKYLFRICMEGEWKKVIEMYKNDKTKRTHKARITRSGDTCIHVAVSNEKEDVVEQLVNLICLVGEQESLKIQNERGNTALHFAASMGSLKMCNHIARVDPSSLVSIRNVDGETPLFLAALHGRKQVFMSLHHLYHRDLPNIPVNYSDCTKIVTRNDGDTILHCAVAGNYFDLAFQIIHIYDEHLAKWKKKGGYDEHLANSKNKEGFSPLHLLASKPSAFRSSSRFGRYEKIVYEVAYTLPLRRFLSKKFARKDQSRTEILDLEAPEKNAKPNREETQSSGSTRLNQIRRKKEKHVWSIQIMNELVKRACMYEFDDYGSKLHPELWDKVDETASYSFEIFDEGEDITSPVASAIQEQQPSTTKGETQQQKKGDEKDKVETPTLIAAKNGVTEMVEKILELFPVAVHDIDSNKKNIVLLAVENRKSHLYEFLLKRKNLHMFNKVDNEGNSALHLAAKLGDYKPWLIPGAALQMHWEIKWYLFVKESMPPHFFRRNNKKKKTPRDIFCETHKDLIKDGGEWLNKISESCSMVSALIATVAFATSSTLPGGVQEGTGHPTLEKKPAFTVFAMTSLFALCCSVTSVVVFLSVLTSRYEARDFGKNLPRKLILGLTSLFMSITCMLFSFCAGHLFVLKDELVYAAFPVYGVTFVPMTLFALAQFPLYFDLIWATFKKVPTSSYKTTPF